MTFDLGADDFDKSLVACGLSRLFTITGFVEESLVTFDRGESLVTCVTPGTGLVTFGSVTCRESLVTSSIGRAGLVTFSAVTLSAGPSQAVGRGSTRLGGYH